ncbi:cold shock domain-containing protein [uncultured Pseudomonas sp.]|uniref:cold shock domain-containing protein n=1 Tax=uncultured Pseudomonas sp. TaxID=114707 RepID=UPI0025EDD3B3|nr:cold shock domain-containing protein [uncultured Pseudomonas sp.]
MSEVKVAKVKLYNDKLKSGFLDHEIDDDDVILPTEAVGSLNLKNGDEVSFELTKKGDRHYATNVKLAKS